jgi:hypothetical protein
MPRDELSGPDLDGVIADANAVGLPYVVIGGFSGIIDVLRGGLPPLDYDTVAGDAIMLDRCGERVNGELPIDPIPGLDDV